MHFEESGSGDVPIIFLHYFGGSSRTWKPVVDLLKDRFRCIAIDLPGFGSSSPLPSPASVERVAGKVNALLEKLRLKKYVLVGHSMGGKIAMQIATASPPTVRQLILVAPSPPTPEPMSEQETKELLAAFGNAQAFEKIAKGLVAEPLVETALKKIVDDNLRIQQPAWADWIEAGSKEDISTTVKKIHAPVLVISGEKDPNFSTQFLQKEVGGHLPGARFVEIKNAGHLLPVEAPEMLAQTIVRTIS